MVVAPEVGRADIARAGNEIAGRTRHTQIRIRNTGQTGDLQTDDLLVARARVVEGRTSQTEAAVNEVREARREKARRQNLGINENIRETEIAIDVAEIAIGRITNRLKELLVRTTAATADGLVDTARHERRHRHGGTEAIVSGDITRHRRWRRDRDRRHARATRGNSDTNEPALAVNERKTSVIGRNIDVNENRLRQHPTRMISVCGVDDTTLRDAHRTSDSARQIAIEAQIAERVDGLTNLQLVRAAPLEMRVTILDLRLASVEVILATENTQEGNILRTRNTDDTSLVDEGVVAVVHIVNGDENTRDRHRDVRNRAGRTSALLGDVIVLTDIRITVEVREIGWRNENEMGRAGDNTVLQERTVAARR